MSIPTEPTATNPLGANRFAPTPSGALHMGSLYLAFIDYCEAKQAGRQWYLRIDDVDAPRVVDGAIATITECLRAHGLDWDGKLMQQSMAYHYYDDAIAQLADQGLIFQCDCTRKQLIREGHVGDQGIRYPGTCRYQIVKAEALDELRDKTLRLRVTDQPIHWLDHRLGKQCENLQATVGDIVLRRNDGVYAFHMATVVDDARLRITHINRGMDLIGSAARQIYLQKQLGYLTPQYAHYPLIRQANGQKLAKQHHSPAVDNLQAVGNLQQILRWLRYPEHDIARCQTVEACKKLGIEQWRTERGLTDQVSGAP